MRKKFEPESKQQHMDVIFSDGKNCIKEVIYRHLSLLFEKDLVKGETYTITKANLKAYKGVEHNLQAMDFQLVFTKDTEVNYKQNINDYKLLKINLLDNRSI